MRKLRIVGCTDPMMWYAGLVGQLVELVRLEASCYWGKEPSGYTNIVRKVDAQVVWIDQDGKPCVDGDLVRCACGEAELRLSHNTLSAYPLRPASALLERSHSMHLCGASFERAPHVMSCAAEVRESMEEGARKGQKVVLRYGDLCLRVGCYGIKWYHERLLASGRPVDLCVEEFDQLLDEALGCRPAREAPLLLG